MENGDMYWIGFLLIASATAVSVQPSVKIEVDKTLVETGESFKFVCMVSDLASGASFLRIQKYYTKADDTKGTLILATNSILSSELKTLDRYTIGYERGENKTVINFIFTVSDAQHEDSGEYACVIMEGSGVILEDSKQITVIDADNFVIEMTVTRINHPDEHPMTFSSDSEEVHEYELDEHEPFHVTVRTSETNPEPALSFLVGHVNINDQFVTDVLPKYFEGEHRLLAGIKYAVTAQGTVEVDHSYRSGFRVVARVADREQSVGFNVKFTGYPPVIDDQCPRSILAGKYQKDVSIECSITSAEPVEVIFYYFRSLRGELNKEKVVIRPDDKDLSSDYHYKAHLDEDPENSAYKVSLHMPIMFPQMFTTYTLEASNSKGNVTYDIVLEEDPSKSLVSPSEASHLTVTTAVTFVLAIAATILQHI